MSSEPAKSLAEPVQYEQATRSQKNQVISAPFSCLQKSSKCFDLDWRLLWPDSISRRRGLCEESVEKRCERCQINPKAKLMHG